MFASVNASSSSSLNRDIPLKSHCLEGGGKDEYSSMLTDTILILKLILVHNRKRMDFNKAQMVHKATVFIAITRGSPCQAGCCCMKTFCSSIICPTAIVYKNIVTLWMWSGMCHRETQVQHQWRGESAEAVSAACPALLPEGILSNIDFPSWDGVNQRFCVFPGEWKIHSVYHGIMGKNQDGGGNNQWENK